MGSKTRGFTLVEMMIALVVLSLISVGTLTAMRTLGMTHERLTVTTTRVDELRQVSQFLRNSLRQALVPPNTGFSGTWAIPVPGLPIAETDEIVWLAPFDGAGIAGGLTWFRLYRDGSTLRLQLQAHRDSVDHDAWPALGVGNVLVDKLDAFHIDFRLSPLQPWGGPPSEEDMLQRLPAGLRISIKADGRYWPDIVVMPDQTGGQF